MEAVVMIDAVPGYEDSVEAKLSKLDGLTTVVRIKRGNHDFAIMLDVGDADELERLLSNELRIVNGVRAVEHVAEPDEDLLTRLRGA